MLGQLAKGRDLAAEHRQHRRGAIGVVELEDVVAGDSRRILGIVVEERPNTGKRWIDVGARELAHAIAVDRAEQVGDFVFVGRDVLGLAAIGNVGGADQAEIALIGVDEDHPLVVVLQQIGLRPVPELRDHDVAALDQPHAPALR